MSTKKRKRKVPVPLPSKYEELLELFKRIQLICAVMTCTVRMAINHIGKTSSRLLTLQDFLLIACICPTQLTIGSQTDPVLGIHKTKSPKTIQKRVSEFEAALRKRVAHLMSEFPNMDINTVVEKQDPIMLASLNNSKRKAIAILPQPSSLTELEVRLREFQDSEQIIHSHFVDAKPAVYSDVVLDLRIVHALSTAMGIDRFKLYRHQAKAIETSKCSDIVISTGTASGKTLVFLYPILCEMLGDEESTSLLIYPTKALAQDQLQWIRSVVVLCGFDSSAVGTYDGDTHFEERADLRRRARILLTNPDTIHHSMLSDRVAFSRVLSNLSHVVLDEAHTYHGAFGSHVACILWRMLRVSRKPRFILCTATLANPVEFAQQLIKGRNFSLISTEDCGAPRGPKLHIIWKPNDSAHYEAARIVSHLMAMNLRTIVFCKSRETCELVSKYCSEIFQESSSEDVGSLASKIKSYRAGYSIPVRREIESDLFSGRLLAIVSTCALELGIDVGTLDATVQVGFPGSISSFWQQCGRAGRSGRMSTSIYIPYDSPLDQYLAKHPSYLYESNVESVMVNAANSYIISNHLLCASWERPLQEHEMEGVPLATVDGLVAKKWLKRSPRALSLISNGSWKFIQGPDGEVVKTLHSPHGLVSIRNICEVTFEVVVAGTGQVLDSIGEDKAYLSLYPGSVLLNQSREYIVENLSTESLQAVVSPRKVSYYTKPRKTINVDVTNIVGKRILNVARDTPCYIQFVKASVIQKVYGYTRFMKKTGVILDKFLVKVPSVTFCTEALYVDLPPGTRLRVLGAGLDFTAGIHALAHIVHSLIPLHVLCNLSDVETVCLPEFSQVILYDSCRGGLGLSRICFESKLESILHSAWDTIRNCACKDNGCPSCIQSSSCNELTSPLSKEAAALILKCMLTSPTAKDTPD